MELRRTLIQAAWVVMFIVRTPHPMIECGLVTAPRARIVDCDNPTPSGRTAPGTKRTRATGMSRSGAPRHSRRGEPRLLPVVCAATSADEIEYDTAVVRYVPVLALCARVAHADATVDKSAAEQLFEEGRVELASGRADVACTKFEQSILKDPRAIGTLMNLGLCNERRGRLATALERFTEAFDRAREADQRELQRAAQEYIVELRTKVPVIAISYEGPPLAGERLVIDDRVITRDRGELVLDPGPHTVVFTASDRLPHEVSLVAKPATRVSLRLPVLQAPQAAKNPRRFVAKLVTVSGAVVTTFAGGLALYARHQYRSQFEGAMPHCGVQPPIDGRPACDAIGQQAVDDARRGATVATVVGVAGIAIIATGLGLWLTTPAEQVRVGVSANPAGGSLLLGGSF
jgi:hypothetical protein